MGRKEGNPKHGMSYSSTYHSYNSMKQRCLNSKNPSYKNYGARGVSISEKWLGEDGFRNFVTDMGERPPNRTLERINNDGGYTPRNCKWATRLEQASNKRTTSKFGVGITLAHGGYMVRLKRKYVGYTRTLEAAKDIREKAILEMREK